MGKHKDKTKKRKAEKKEKKKAKKRRHSTSSSDGSTDEWVEKPRADNGVASTSKCESGSDSDADRHAEVKNNDWLAGADFLTTSNHDRRKEREAKRRSEKEKGRYDPGKSVRELNPYWKDGGDGLPSSSSSSADFKKPSSDDEGATIKPAPRVRPSNWRKKPVATADDGEVPSTSSRRSDDEDPPPTTDKEFNQLAAKIVKAEIKGDQKLVDELKAKLERARELRDSSSSTTDVLLTETDSKGYSRPAKSVDGGKKRKVETHAGGERVRYFADDDRYSLKEMFEDEKFNSADAMDRELTEVAAKAKDDVDELFAESICKSTKNAKQRSKDRSVAEHRKLNSRLDVCTKCLQNMPKHLMISMGDTIYLSLPPYEPLTPGHCLLVPIRHAPCSTQLDENEWNELCDFRKALTRMFRSNGEDVVFFETSADPTRYPHMVVECVPLPKDTGDAAPAYFKKAIDESETEWSTNRKLISVPGGDVRKAVPRGLPYFAVSFGNRDGYAHVVEDRRAFPDNFAQEIIGGMLELHHSRWRRPKAQTFEEQSGRVLEFSRNWNEFNFT